jgi:hypothetical protein
MNPPGALVALAIALAAPPAAGFAVSGTLRAADGRPLVSAAVKLSPVVDGRVFPASPGNVRLVPNGGYAFANVPPGHYLVRARGETEGGGVALFATFAVTVEHEDVVGADLTLTPGAVVSGWIAVETRAGMTPPPLTKARVRAPLADDGGFGDVYTGTIGPDGAFTIRGVAPGVHQLLVEGLPFPWILSQGDHRGRALLGLAIETRPGERLIDLRLTLAERGADVAGAVKGAGGGSGASAIVVVFPADRGLRLFPARYVRVVRPDAAGGYRAAGVPDGEYFVIAVTGIVEAAATAPALLDRLEPHALRITLPAAAVTVRDLVAIPLPDAKQPARNEAPRVLF